MGNKDGECDRAESMTEWSRNKFKSGKVTGVELG